MSSREINVSNVCEAYKYGVCNMNIVRVVALNLTPHSEASYDSVSLEF